MEAKCFLCGAEGPKHTYMQCLHEGVLKTVCVRCLPMLIHGQH